MTSAADTLLDRIRVAIADEYLVEREIGRGGMAAVFLARDIALDRPVAIKVMLPDLTNLQGFQERFVIEARTAAHLDHPGIVTVYEGRQRAGLLYIAMKFIEGHTVDAVLRAHGPIEPTATALIGSRVAEALHFAHSEGVVHRDVKPSNIMLDTRGRPVVTDFGIARVMAAQSVTVAGSVLGTPSHMSPEQWSGLPATAASDQYSLGITMYEMLTGRAPFSGSLFELMDAHRGQAPPPIGNFVAGFDPGLDEIVMRMLAKNPAERWASMADVAQALAKTFPAAAYPSPLLEPPAPVAQDPVPVTPRPVPLPIGSEGASVHARETGGARVLLWSAAGIAATILLATLLWSAHNSMRAASPAARTDSVPAVVPSSARATDSAARATALDSAARDSVARDSVARESAARDSVARAMAARDSIVRDSSAAVAAREKARTATVKRPRVDSSAAVRNTPRATPEAVAVRCARLLERVSLGEKLTDAERALLRQSCPK